VAYGQSLEEGLVTLKPETKFYQEVKQNFKNFHLTRIENISIPGVPDLLCYNKNHTFFTIELKVTVKPLAPRSKKLCESILDEVKLYEGSSILQLAACGLSLDACCSGLDACRLLLEELGA
jgi:hypothetical protein